MPGFKGRALIYPGLLIAGWIIGRNIALSAPDSEPPMAKFGHANTRLASVSPIATDAACPMPWLPYPSVTPPTPPPIWSGQTARQLQLPSHGIFSNLGNKSALTFTSSYDEIASDRGDFELNVATPTAEAESGVTQLAILPKPRRLQFYSYNFWRQGGADAALAPNAQYGGSQYGAIATWDPVGQAGRGPALLLRASGTPDGVQREIAIGTRWQPKQDWPLSLSLERRFRANARDSFAAYLAGGVDRLPVVGRLALDAYGQAGYSLGGRSSPFVDAQARLQHPLAKPIGIPIRIGAGAWAGGQKGAFRGDVGPTVSADINARLTRFTLQVDWRKRIVGNAAPADGLAVTVSTGF